MNITDQSKQIDREPTPTRPKYAARLAQSADEVRRAQQLRFEVFNLELGEGLAESYVTGLDIDPFDEFCDHLIVEERRHERNCRHVSIADRPTSGGESRILQRAGI